VVYKWHDVFAFPVLTRIFDHCANFGACSLPHLLGKLVRFRWFYEEFTQTNGLYWLPLIAMNDIYTRNSDSRAETVRDGDALPNLLVDQIVFSTANQEIDLPLSSTYKYLQSLGTMPVLHSSDTHKGNGLHRLQAALLWVFERSVEARDAINGAQDPSTQIAYRESLQFATIGLQKLNRYGWPSAGEIRSFEFVKYMSDDRWEMWIERLKVLMIGTKLGGLNVGPLSGKNRFIRDPESICGIL
jgi:hypothetical protein